MDAMELRTILEKHIKWIHNPIDGQRADLHGADLRGADLYKADLHGADLHGADLYKADLHGADLHGADLHGADLRWANLRRANLYKANLYEADLYEADLRRANLYDANLYEANLYKANLYEANLYEANLYKANLYEADLYEANLSHPMACPEEGAFIGYKKAKGVIVKLLILDDALRSSATSRKCRCSKAKVVSITTLEGGETDLTEVASDHDADFVYKIGEIVAVENFSTNRWNECAPGIHFFITRQEAVDY